MKALTLLFVATAGIGLYGQGPQPMPATSPAVALAALIEEAQLKNPEIRATSYSYQAAGHKTKAAGALPDTQIMLQQLNVGSPRPFAGYTNSDFAYIGLGVAQEFPWPGKRSLRAQVAGAQADAMRTQSGAVSRIVIEQVKMTYFKLAYLQATLDILLRDD